MILGWATGGIIFGMMSDRLGPGEDDGRDAADLLGVHRAVGAGAVVGGLHHLSLPGRPRRRRHVRRGDDAGGRERAGPVPRDGARLAAGAVGDRQHHRLAGQPGDSARARPTCSGSTAAGACCSSSASCRRCSIVPIMFVLKEPESWLRAKAEAARRPAARKNIGSPIELFRHPRWRRNTIIGLMLGVSGMIGLWGIGFFSPELISTALAGEPQAVVDTGAGARAPRSRTWARSSAW